MDLSNKERQIVEQLRKQERRWRSSRWILLCLGLFSLALSVTGLLIVIPFLQRADAGADSGVTAALMLALFHPPILAFGCLAIHAFYCTIRDWRGDNARILLLTLVDVRN